MVLHKALKGPIIGEAEQQREAGRKRRVVGWWPNTTSVFSPRLPGHALRKVAVVNRRVVLWNGAMGLASKPSRHCEDTRISMDGVP